MNGLHVGTHSTNWKDPMKKWTLYPSTEDRVLTKFQTNSNINIFVEHLSEETTTGL